MKHSIPKRAAWLKVRSILLCLPAQETVPDVPGTQENPWDKERAWVQMKEWAKRNEAMPVIDALQPSDFLATETFAAESIRPEPYTGRIGEILLNIKAESSWTKRKRLLVEELKSHLTKCGYIEIPGHGVRYRVSAVGDSFIYGVPQRKLGHLRPFRGQTVRLVCTGSGSRSYRSYMVGKFDEYD